MTQQKFVRDLLKKANMSDANPCPTPMCPGIKLSKHDPDLFDQPTTYRSIVGSLQYLTMTRPDIAFAVNKLSQYLQAPAMAHWNACKRVLRYLAGTSTQGLKFEAAPRLNLVAYTDADYASSVDDRRSTTGYCVYLGTSLISWSSKKQDVVSRSSTESEYRALSSTASEVVWLQSLFKELGVALDSDPSIVWCDNMGASALASNSVFHARTKHIEVDVHFISEKIAAKLIEVRYVPTEEQIADLFTKPLTIPRFVHLCSKLNLAQPV